jgi:hypothetical protein
MGLDMYLERDVYIGANFEHNEVELEISGKTRHGKIEVDVTKVSSITESIAYWRKANHIHQWFVVNVQNGVDECQRSWMPNEKLRELVDLCNEIVDAYESGSEWEELANEKLPPQAGFFFGSTELDEYYIQDCKDTIRQLEPYLDDSQADFYYHSSW